MEAAHGIALGLVTHLDELRAGSVFIHQGQILCFLVTIGKNEILDRIHAGEDALDGV